MLEVKRAQQYLHMSLCYEKMILIMPTRSMTEIKEIMFFEQFYAVGNNH